MNTTSMPIASNRVADIRRYCRKVLAPIYGDGESASMERMLFEAFLGWDAVQMLANGDSSVNQSDLLRFYWAVEDLKRHRPIQHIIGHVDFCGCRIEVSPDVLIPRPETEELAAAVMDEAEEGMRSGAWPETLRVADLCTGSGCIAIALASRLRQASVVGVELSEAALAVARRNVQANGTQVALLHADVLCVEQLCRRCGGPHDVIVSNPPYVRQRERKDMQANVLNYEPSMALFVDDDDALRFYRAIADFARQTLSPHGMVAVEINECLGRETLRLFERRGFRGLLKKDFRERDRFVVCHRDL